MAFLACGLNHKTAPIDLREQVIFTPENLVGSLKNLTQSAGIREAVILSTCNRVEIYCPDDQNNDAAISDWLSQFHQVPAANLTPHLYIYREQDAIKHLFRVASGLDSMILGEPQILGQLKQAVNIAEAAGTLGKQLRRLFHQAFSVSKHIRSSTEIGLNPVSLGYIIIHLARRIFADLTRCHALLIGAGEINQLIAQHLHAQGLKQISIANRSHHRAQAIANQYAMQTYQLEDVPHLIAQTDIIIAATHSKLPLLGKGSVESALKTRKHRPIVMIDLGVPRNLEPEISDLEDIYLYALDDLQSILDDNKNKRSQAAQLAEAIIDAKTLHFLGALRSLDAISTIRAYRDKMHALRDLQLEYALQELSLGDKPEEVVQKLARNLTNKFLHHPCVTLRKASYAGESELITAAEKLFDL